MDTQKILDFLYDASLKVVDARQAIRDHKPEHYNLVHHLKNVEKMIIRAINQLEADEFKKE